MIVIFPSVFSLKPPRSFVSSIGKEEIHNYGYRTRPFILLLHQGATLPPTTLRQTNFTDLICDLCMWMQSPVRLISRRWSRPPCWKTLVILPRPQTPQRLLPTLLPPRASPLSAPSRNFNHSFSHPVRYFTYTHFRRSGELLDNHTIMGSLGPYQRKHRVAVIGSGNWYVHLVALSL